MRRRRPGHGDDRGAPLIELHVEEHGDGLPAPPDPGSRLVEVGLAGQWAVYAQRRRVLAFDNRGTGLSAKPPGPYSIELIRRRRRVRARRPGSRPGRCLRALHGRLYRAHARRSPARARALARARGYRPGRAEHELCRRRHSRSGCRPPGCPARRRSAGRFRRRSPRAGSTTIRTNTRSGSPHGSTHRRRLECWLAQVEAATATRRSASRWNGSTYRPSSSTGTRSHRARGERPLARCADAACGARRATEPGSRADARAARSSERSSARSSTGSRRTRRSTPPSSSTVGAR